MAFWGIEVKPGKPVTHSFNKVQRRLRISQATLGIGSATEKSLVQCNVGNKHPVFLCALLPDKTESCHLDLEFEESDDVIFSVIGPRSVYLTGYYVSNIRSSNPNSDTESYGEDIQDTATEESGHHTDEDGYESSFIDDDDDPVVSPPSPVSSAGADEKMPHKMEMKERKGINKQQRKKFQVIDSDDDDDATSQENEDEENYLLSVFKSKKEAKAIVSEGEKTGTVYTDGKKADCGTSDYVPKEIAGGEVVERETESSKSKKKRKEHSDEVKTLGGNHSEALKEDKAPQEDVEDDNRHRDLLQSSKHNQTLSTNGKFNGHSSLMLLAEISSRNGQKTKKRRKVGGTEEGAVRGNDEICSNIIVEDHSMQHVPEAGKKNKDLPATTEGDEKPTVDRGTNFDRVDDERKSKKAKKKKKKSKAQENDATFNMNISVLSENENKKSTRILEERNFKSMSSQVRTLSNGLTIEELSSGGKDGKVATLGRKVKVLYTAMLKEGGCVFDSNIGKTPYKFRLGDGKIIDGWNVGLEGMHVGDKRRLVIPPSMGYGSQGAGENIPPNSWLVYDVELVGAH